MWIQVQYKFHPAKRPRLQNWMRNYIITEMHKTLTHLGVGVYILQSDFLDPFSFLSINWGRGE